MWCRRGAPGRDAQCRHFTPQQKHAVRRAGWSPPRGCILDVTFTLSPGGCAVKEMAAAPSCSSARSNLSFPIGTSENYVPGPCWCRTRVRPPTLWISEISWRAAPSDEPAWRFKQCCKIETCETLPWSHTKPSQNPTSWRRSGAASEIQTYLSVREHLV